MEWVQLVWFWFVLVFFLVTEGVTHASGPIRPARAKEFWGEVGIQLDFKYNEWELDELDGAGYMFVFSCCLWSPKVSCTFRGSNLHDRAGNAGQTLIFKFFSGKEKLTRAELVRILFFSCFVSGHRGRHALFCPEGTLILLARDIFPGRRNVK